MKIAICVVGTIGAGKSEIGSRRAAKLNLPFLSETLFDNGLMGILDRMAEYDRVVIEHCELLKFSTQIEGWFPKVVFVYVDIAEALAWVHKEARIRNGATGDFLKIDPIIMKKEIESLLLEISIQHTCIRVRIESDDDYESTVARLTDTLATYLVEDEKR